jgi:Sulfotransferase family
MSERDNPVIIMAVGRSGSTLLMRLLNCSPDIVIWGEHNGFLTALGRAFHALTCPFATDCMHNSERFVETVLNQQPIILARGERWSCEWVNAFTKSDVVAAFRNLLLDLLARRVPEGVRWGFKEIRYHGEEIELLRALFPRAQFVLLLRNPIHVLQSISRHFTRGDPKRTMHSMLRYIDFLTLIQKQLEEKRQDVLICHYELLIERPDEQLSRLEQFLGTSLARSTCEAILGERKKFREPPADVHSELAAFVETSRVPVGPDKVLVLADQYRTLLNAARMEQTAGAT